MIAAMKPQNYLQQIAGVSIYPIITMLIFILLFTFVAYSLLKPRHAHFQSLSALPLEDEFNDESTPS